MPSRSSLLVLVTLHNYTELVNMLTYPQQQLNKCMYCNSKPNIIQRDTTLMSTEKENMLNYCVSYHKNYSE